MSTKFIALKPAYAYIRRSKDDITGNSFAAQKQEIIKKAEALGLEIVRWFFDEHSSFRYSGDREGIEQLFDTLETNPRIKDVVTESAQRLGRDKNHLGYIRYRLKEEFFVRVHYANINYDPDSKVGVMMDGVGTSFNHVSSMQKLRIDAQPYESQHGS